MAKEEKYYGLIGYPLIHSFSRTFFNKKFAAESIPARYDNYEIPSIDRLPEMLRSNPLLAGLNVTIPYKEQIIPYLDELDPLAARAGAVNVVKFVPSKTPVGMYPHVDECPAIPYEFLTPDHLCYDLIYNPDTTMFMKRAAEHGAETKNGLEMLLLQAFVSWDIWNR